MKLPIIVDRKCPAWKGFAMLGELIKVKHIHTHTHKRKLPDLGKKESKSASKNEMVYNNRNQFLNTHTKTPPKHKKGYSI